MNTDNYMVVPGQRKLYVPGWANLEENHTTRAKVLQSLVSLEMIGVVPTYRAILKYMIESLGVNISNNSVQTVIRHLDNLSDDERGHVSRKNAKLTTKGGATAPFKSRYVFTVSSTTLGKERGRQLA